MNTKQKDDYTDSLVMRPSVDYQQKMYLILLLSAKSFNKKKERADSIIVESAQIVTFVFATKHQ